MSLPLAHYLKDFSVPAGAEPSFGEADFGGLDGDPFDIGFTAPEEPTPVDIEAERRQAYAEGHETAEREARERHMAEIAELEAAHASQLAALAERYEAESVAAIAGGMRAIANDVAASVSDQVAHALAPLLSELIADKAIRDLAQLIEMAILSGDAGTIVVRGPAALYEKLQSELPETPGLLRHVEADDLDLSVDVGETLLVTRMSAWTASLKKVLG